MAQSNGLNRNQLKYLVIVAMLIDHIAWAFVPLDTLLGQVMHGIGRLTGPTMAYFVAEGYHYTRNVRKYAVRLGVFALFSWVPFVYFEYGTLPLVIQDGSIVGFYPQFGVLYTLLLSLLAIWLWDRGTCSSSMKYLGTIGLCLLSLFGDWAIFDVLYGSVSLPGQSQEKVDSILLDHGMLLFGCILGISLVERIVPIWNLSGSAPHSVWL